MPTMFSDILNEDTIQCFFFSSSPKCDFNYWKRLCDSINAKIEILSKEYLWHRDEFKICYPININKNEAIPDHLRSITCFGDNIEDEWFVVYLIFEITKEFEDVIVQIKDSDGDFLLIEAADYLPSWAKPENTENRVFIYKNHINIIPPSVDTSSKLDLKDALTLLLKFSEQTRASADIHNAVLRRISKYPNQIKEHFHKALVNLPLHIGALLTLKPPIISSLVNSYCHHDLLDAKSCSDVKYEDYVTIEVKFTKCQYAMLLHSKPLKNIHFFKTSDKKNILGLKLSYGYEMVMKDSSADIFASKEFNKFLKSLKDNHYFKENLEGSKDYKLLLENAKKYFSIMECPIKSHISNTILHLITTEDFKQIKESLKHKAPIEADYIEDSDDWLNINSEQLNDFLNTNYGKKVKLEDNVVTVESVTSKLNKFFLETSDFEGIETNEIEDNNTIEFSSDEFVNSIQKMLNLISSNNCSIDEDDLSDFDSDDDYDNIIRNQLDKELNTKLHNENDKMQQGAEILENIARSVKEEGGSSGPSSNLFRTIGVKKTDLLDSDDELQ